MRKLLADLNPFVARMDQPCRFRVPFRRVHTDTIQEWARQCVWCLIVLPIFSREVDQVICKCGSYGELA